MEKLKIYLCGHDNLVRRYPNYPHFQYVNLDKLNIGKYQLNQLSESRIFLSDLDLSCEYIGFLSLNYNIKFTSPNLPATKKEGQPVLPMFKHLHKIELKKDILHCCVISQPVCKEWFKDYFPGILPYLNDIENFSKLSLNSFPSILSNSFVCHVEVFKEFLSVWRPIFDYAWENYNLNDLADRIKGHADRRRAAGYLFEAISVLAWTETIKRKNLSVKFFDVPKKKFKRILI
ncbi:MAG: hypothetical protein EKK64_09235 [Neisseriaceae bacterium]|nr:MAG: hypothetical protein EKK64_09235 [Neisseriaceae bacterium]